MVRNVRSGLEKAASLGKTIPPEVLIIAANVEEPGRLGDLTAANLELKVPEAQAILEIAEPVARLKKVYELLAKELELLDVQSRISTEAKGEMDKMQRQYFLRQQMKAIQKELGEGNELQEEIKGYQDKLKKLKVAEEVREELEKQIGRLAQMHPESAETTVVRNYLDWMFALPWVKSTVDNLDLKKAEDDPGRGPLRPGKDQGAHPGVPGRPQPVQEDQGPDPLLRRAARRGQDLARPVHRPGPGPGVPPHLPGRRARRGRDPRPPPDLRRGPARTDHPGPPPGRLEQPGLHDGRDGQDRGRFPRRPVLGPARGPGPGAELHLPRPLPGRAVRPVQGACSSPRPTCSTPSSRPSGTGWRSSSWPATPRRRSSQIANRHLVPKEIEENALTPRLIQFSTGAIQKIISAYTREAGVRNLEREIAAVCRKIGP